MFQKMDLSRLNEVGAGGSYFLPLKKIPDLPIGEKYIITSVKKVTVAKFKPARECVVITLGGEYNVFLPTRVANELLVNSENYDKFESSVKSRTLNFSSLGPDPQNKNIQRVEFTAVN